MKFLADALAFRLTVDHRQSFRTAEPTTCRVSVRELVSSAVFCNVTWSSWNQRASVQIAAGALIRINQSACTRWNVGEFRDVGSCCFE